MVSAPKVRVVVALGFFFHFFVKFGPALHVLALERQKLLVVDVGRPGVRNQNDLDNCVSGDESLDAITIENFEACFP